MKRKSSTKKKNSVFRRLVMSMRGCFLPKSYIDDNLFKDINVSLDRLDYEGQEHDRQNMRNDFEALNRDFRKSVEAAKREYKVVM